MADLKPGSKTPSYREVFSSFLLGAIIALIASLRGKYGLIGFFVGAILGGYSLRMGTRVAFGYGVGFLLPGIIVPLLLMSIQAMSRTLGLPGLTVFPLAFAICFGAAGFIGGTFVKRGIGTAVLSACCFSAGGFLGGFAMAISLLVPAPKSLLAGMILAIIIPFVGGGILLVRVLRTGEPSEQETLVGASRLRWENIAIPVLSIATIGVAVVFLAPFFMSKPNSMPFTPPKSEEWPAIDELGSRGNHMLRIEFFGKRRASQDSFDFSNDRYGELNISHNGETFPVGGGAFGENHYSSNVNIGPPSQHRGMWTVKWDYEGREYLVEFELVPDSSTSSKCFLRQRHRTVTELADRLLVVPPNVCKKMTSYVAMGSSPTQGAGSSDSQNRGYVARIANAFKKIHPDLQVSNIASAGLTLGTFRQQIPDVQKAKPEIITIWPLQDYHHTSPEIFQRVFAEILDSLAKDGATIFVGDTQFNPDEVCGPLRKGNCWNANEYQTVEKKNEIMRSIAQERPSVILVPLLQPGISHPGWSANEKYPNDSGHMYIAAAFWKSISEWLTCNDDKTVAVR